MWPFNKNQTEKELEPNTLLVDLDRGDYRSVYLKKPSGRQWRHGGKLMYFMLRSKRITTPLGPPKEFSELPEKLYRASVCKGADIIFGLPDSMLEKFNTMAVYLLIAGLLFFIFLMANG